MYSTDLNCAGVVVRALKAGGADAYFPAPTPKKLMEPNMIAPWARIIRVKVEALDKKTEVLRQKAKQRLTSPSFVKIHSTGQIDTELMSAQKWKAVKDHEHLDKKRPLTPEIVRLTSSLTQYHQYQWNDDTTFGLKLKCLQSILDALLEHFSRHKDKNKQWLYIAVMSLQLIALLRSKAVTLAS